MRQETINRSVEAFAWADGLVEVEADSDRVRSTMQFTRDEALKLAEFIIESVGDEATREAYRLAQVAGEEAK